MVVPVSNKVIVLLLLTVIRKFAAYFVLLNLTLLFFDSHSESKVDLGVLY